MAGSVPLLSLNLGDARHFSTAEILSLARVAEDLGFAGFWIGENWGLDAFAVLGAVAVGTNRIRLGTSIVNVYSRTPTQIAQAAATLEELSGGGRFVLGLGVSTKPIVEGWHGRSYEHNAKRLAEATSIIRAVLAGEPAQYNGDVFSVAGPRFARKPPANRVPIAIGASGPRNVQLALSLGDYWIASSTAFATKTFQPSAERAVKTVALAQIFCLPGDEDVKKLIKRGIVFSVTTAPRDDPRLDVVKLRELRQGGDWDAAISLIPDERIDEQATLSDEAGCAAAIERLGQSGVDEVALLIPVGMTALQVRTSLGRLASYYGLAKHNAR